jgi:hypothetical protein
MHVSDITMHLSEVWSEGVCARPWLILEGLGHQNLRIFDQGSIEIVDVLGDHPAHIFPLRFRAVFLELKERIVAWVGFAFIDELDKVEMPLPHKLRVTTEESIS